MLSGNADDIEREVSVLRAINAELARHYAKKSGKTVAEMADAMRAETTYTAQQALEVGLVDEVIDDQRAVAVARMLIAASVTSEKNVTATAPAARPNQPTRPKEENIMDEIIAKALGVAVGADPLTVAKRAQEITAAAEGLARLESALGSKGDAAVGAIEALKASALKVEELTAEVEAMRARAEKDEHDRLFAQGFEAGQITAATSEFWRAQSVETLRGFVALAPKSVPTGTKIKQPAVNAAGHEPGSDVEVPDWNALNWVQRHELKFSNPEAYDRSREAAGL